MEKSFDLGVYLKELEAVKTIFAKSTSVNDSDQSPSRFNSILSSLDNYLEQIKSIRTCKLFRRNDTQSVVGSGEWNDYDNVKIKLVYKLNNLVNECLREIDLIL